MSKSKFRVVWGALESRGQVLWAKVGLAWEGKDGSIFARLNVFPLSGRICISREPGDPGDQASVRIEQVAP